MDAPMTNPASSNTRGWRYWYAMHNDQLRRKRLLHDRYDRLHHAAQQVVLMADVSAMAQGSDEAAELAYADAVADLREALQ